MQPSAQRTVMMVIGAILLSQPLLRAQSDAPSGYGITENENFDQTSTATPTADPTTADQFYANVYAGSTGTILTTSTLTVPAGRSGVVSFTQNGNGVSFNEYFTNRSLMVNAFGMGSYSLKAKTSLSHTYTYPINMPTDALGSMVIPQISNTGWSGGNLAFNPAQDLTLNWNNSNGGNVGLTIFNSSVSQSLTSGTTSYTVPANTLSLNTVYQCLLQFNDPSNDGFYQHSTRFSIGTNDVGNYYFVKAVNYDQSSASTPALDADDPYQFFSSIYPGSNDALFANAAVTTPAGGAGTFGYTVGTQNLYFQENFTSSTALNAAFPSGTGTYNLTVQTTTPSNYTDQFSFGSDNYPSVPKITSMTNASWGSNGALVVGNIAQPVTITFTNSSGAYANYNIDNAGISGGSLGLTSFTIPANTLSNNSYFQGNINLNNGPGSGSTNSNTLPDPGGGVVVFQTQVNFTLQTGSPSSSSTTYNEIFKNHVEVQTSASGPVDGTGNPDHFDAAPYNLDIENASIGTVTGPSSTSFGLTYVAGAGDNNAGDYEYSSGAEGSQSALNTVAPDGTYTFPGGTALSVTGAAYPAASTVTAVNGVAPVWDAQGQLVLDPTIANTITWSSVTVPNFATNGHESFNVDSDDDNFSYIDQEAGATSAAATPFTTYTIPANSMTAGLTYFGTISYYDLPSVPSHPSSSVYYVGGYKTETEFTAIAKYPSGLLQAINFPAIANQTVGAAPFTISATATSGLPVTFSVVSGPATLSGTNNSTVTLTGAGTVVIQASQAGGSPYAAAANVTQSFTVGMASQTITFPSLSTQQVAGTSVTLGATASSGLAITYMITGPASLSGSTLTFTGTGTVMVEAEQGGNSSYSAATPVTQTLNVVAATDVGFYSIQKEIVYDQTGSSTTITDPQQPYQFSSNINYGNTGTVLTSSSLTPPVPSTGTVSYETNSSGQLYFQASFATKNALDAAFDSGTYNFVINTSTPNTYNAQITLGADNYPSVPQVTSVTNATWSNGVLVVGNYAQDVTITWSNPNSASAYFDLNNTGISSNSNSITTTYTIPAGELSNNTIYQGQITLSNYGTISTSIPNVNGQPGYQTQVNFIMQTGTPAAASKQKYVIQKSHVLEQSSNSAPVAASGAINNSDPGPYEIYIESPASGTVSGPSSTSFTLTYDIYDSTYENQSGAIASQSALNTAYPNGTYTFTGISPLSLTGDLYPGTTQVTQVNSSTPVWDAQGQLVLDPTVSNTITWSAVTVPNFSTDGHETAELESTNGGSVDVKQSTGIAASSTTPFTTLTIPANTMTATDTYQFYVNYGEASQYFTVGSSGFAAALYTTETELTAVALKPQTITLPASGGSYVGGTLALNANSSAGLPITYSVISGPATLSGDTLTFTGTGTVTLQASQVGNGTYASVPGETQTYTVSQVPQTDTPTMPPWALLALALLLFVAGFKFHPKREMERG